MNQTWCALSASVSVFKFRIIEDLQKLSRAKSWPWGPQSRAVVVLLLWMPGQRVYKGVSNMRQLGGFAEAQKPVQRERLEKQRKPATTRRRRPGKGVRQPSEGDGRMRVGVAKVNSFLDESSYVAQVLFYVASSFQAFSFLLDCPDSSEILALPRGSGSQGWIFGESPRKFRESPTCKSRHIAMPRTALV